MTSLYLSPDQWREPFILEGPEARHLLTVLRTKPGATVRLFDGRGRTGVFMLKHAERKRAHLAPLSEQTLDRPDRQILLALGWNKSSRRGWVLEKAVEMQAAGLVFWQAERSQGLVPEIPKESWVAQMIAAAKQCGNPWLPSVTTVTKGVEDVIRLFPGETGKVLLWEHASDENLFDPVAIPRTGKTVIVLGPEGGLTDGEADLFIQNGYHASSLGRSTLRWETAALLCLGLCYWENQRTRPSC